MACGRTRVHVGLHPDGRLDEADFDAQLHRLRGRVALVAITGASNVTGYINPIHRLAAKAHAAGAQILVDCAQLAPHRRVQMGSLQDPAHLDFVSISAHKMYAPFGTGALVGREMSSPSGDPDQRGGGTVEIVTLEDVVWAEPPDRDEAGSPNVVGAVALAAAIRQLEDVGMEAVAQHEAELTAYALQRLPAVPGMRLFGDTRPETASERLGVIPLQIDGISHFLVSAILGYEFGIGVRSGCFCAHPYLLHLLGMSQEEMRTTRSLMLSGDRSNMPGMVRASFGLYNTAAEVDALVEALTRIAAASTAGGIHRSKLLASTYPRDGSRISKHTLKFETDMDAKSTERLAIMLRNQRTAALGTLHQGTPLVSMVLFSAADDFVRFYLLASSLAQHTRDFLDNPRAGLMISESDFGNRDPQTLARISLRGEIAPVPPHEPNYNSIRGAYLAKHPASAALFSLGDFALYCFKVETARYVSGFASAFNLKPADLRQTAIAYPAA